MTLQQDAQTPPTTSTIQPIPPITDIHTLDRFTTSPLNSVLNSPPDTLPTVHIFIRYPSYKPIKRADWIALSLSSLKGDRGSRSRRL